jgi:DUF971 family protein
MPTRIEPTNISVIGDELALAWNDGTETYIPLPALRQACPCASCCGEPDALGNVVRPEVSYGPSSFQMRSWQLVGGYAFQPAWADGHATGLYTFPYLRRLGGG